MVLWTKKYFSSCSFSNGSLKIWNYKKSSQGVFEVSDVSLTKNNITVNEMYQVFCTCVCLQGFLK